MQGRPKGVHFTLAYMFLRNKTERLANTALPALGGALGAGGYVYLPQLKLKGQLFTLQYLTFEKKALIL